MKYNYENININDRLYFIDRFNKTRSGKAVLFGPAGWVISQGRGMPQIVGIKNYAGHNESKNRRADHFGKFLNS